jgi:hypothetical protein
MKSTAFREQFTADTDAWTVASGIVNTCSEPVLMVHEEHREIAASPTFYSAFKVSAEDIQDNLIHALENGQLDIPKLHLILEKIEPEIATRPSFYYADKLNSEDTQGRFLCVFGDGIWDLPKLQVLLEKIMPEGILESYEINGAVKERTIR